MSLSIKIDLQRDFAAGVLSVRAKAPSHPMTHTLTHCMHTSIVYLFRKGKGGGEGKEEKLTREKVRGAKVHKAG